MIVFLVSGLWHGANWTYVIWGALHGAGLVLERALRIARIPLRGGVFRLGMMFLTFHTVLLAWIFFRAPSVGSAWLILARTISEAPAELWAFLRQADVVAVLVGLGVTLLDAKIALTAVVLLMVGEVAQETAVTRLFASRPSWWKQTLQITFFYTLALVTAATVAPKAQQFIYFQF